MNPHAHAHARTLRSFSVVWMLLLMLSMPSGGSRASDDPPPIPLVPSVDLPRFMGQWYVIGHIPPDSDRDAHNAVERYELREGRIETTYRRRPGSFEAQEKIETPTGYVVAGSGNALWGMRFWWWFPIKLEYRIAHLEPDYSVTIIGRNKRDYVWLMSRTPQMSDADYDRYRVLIADWGYDTSKLVRIPQRWP
jgi:apolipoprotein D and lipocalin family protein